MHIIKRSGYTVKIKFERDTLAVGQNSYSTEIVNAYIFDGLGNWANNSLIIFTLKNCLFGASSIVKTSGKEMWV